MTSILEQMARAIADELASEADGGHLWTWDHWGEHQRESFRRQAKAALQPLLGELPEDLKDIGFDAFTEDYPDVLRIGAERCFHAMIKAILEGGEG